MERSTTITVWLESVPYASIRSAETLLGATLPQGTRLRAALLAPDLCLGRDRRLYRLPSEDGGLAEPMEVADIAERYSADDLDRMFREALVRQERCRAVAR